MARGKKHKQAGTRAPHAPPPSRKPTGRDQQDTPSIAPLLGIIGGLVVIGILGYLLLGDSVSSGEEPASTITDESELRAPLGRHHGDRLVPKRR